MKILITVQWCLAIYVAAVYAQVAPDTLWTRTYGGQFNDFAYSVIPTQDGGYVIAGQTSLGNTVKILALKLDAEGLQAEWNGTYGGNEGATACEIAQTSDGGYAIGGSANLWGNTRFYLIRLNAVGDTIWTANYGTSVAEAFAMKVCSNGGFIMVGEERTADHPDVWIVRVDEEGDTLWTRSYGGTDSDGARDVAETDDGGFIIVGYTRSNADNQQAYCIKVDSIGNLLWERRFGGENSEIANALQRADNGNFIVVGTTTSYSPGIYSFLVNGVGDTINTHHQGCNASANWGEGVIRMHDGGFVIVGSSEMCPGAEHAIHVIRTDSTGEESWSRAYATGNYSQATSICLGQDSSIVIAGMTSPPDGSNYDYYLVKLKRESCPPTSLPFIDNFDSPELDYCWSWVREDTSHWSLAERPGWLRIETQPGRIYYGDGYNYLMRSRPTGDYLVESKLAINSTQPYQQGGLLIYQDEGNMLEFVRGEYEGLQVLYPTLWNNGFITYNDLSIQVTDTVVWLRIWSVANVIRFEWSANGADWNYVGQGSANWARNESVMIGLKADESIGGLTELPVDFDYFRVDSLPGTTFCGDVSGVWDSSGSPYYVTCDVTVPPGQTLEIQPGVEVLFTGHYKFNVFGNLQAIGTEQDSIVFTRAFPTEESKWWGIRFLNAEDTSRFSHCVVEYGKAYKENDVYPIYSDRFGGGVFAENSLLEVRDCTFRNCIAHAYGGALHLQVASYGLVSRCLFVENTSLGQGGSSAGAAQLNYGGNYLVQQCVFIGNHSNANGGAIGFEMPPELTNTVDHCTFYENTAGISGSVAYLVNGSARFLNCIAYDQTAPVFVPVAGNGSLSVTYSDVQGGYPGAGNIDSDPMFVDAVNGDFHLSEQSPCIDSGDPESPKDSDSTRADMGAYQFLHTELMASPSQLHFGLIDLGTDSTTQIDFFNPTAAPISILDVSNNINAFIVDTVGLGGQVSPYSVYEMNVAFAPTTSGIYGDTLDITTGQQEDSVIRIPLSGEARVILPPVDSLVAQKGPLNGIRLDWAAVTHSITGQPVQDVVYIIYGSTSSDGPYVPFGYSTTNNYVHAFVLNTQPIYFYQVTADVSTGLAIHENGLLPSDKNK